MRFGIRRLDAGGQNGRRYHLFHEDGRIELVADQGSPWLPAEPDRHVRFARANGDIVASMVLPQRAARRSNGQQSLSYVIILDHAVYAIINEHHGSTEAEGAPSPYFIVEVEGMQWLGLKQPGQTACFSLYDAVPADLTIYDEPLEVPLPAPVGQITRSAGEYDFTAEMPAGRLANAALILLALTFMIER